MSATLAAPDPTVCQPRDRLRASKDYVASAVYIVLLSLIAWHLATHFSYSMDMLGYMGNAALLQHSDPVAVHAEVYREVRENMPSGPREHLLGTEKGVPADQNDSRRDRSINPYHAAEFFPCYAIRPLFIEILYLVHRAGFGLVHGLIFISVLSYFG